MVQSVIFYGFMQSFPLKIKEVSSLLLRTLCLNLENCMLATYGWYEFPARERAFGKVSKTDLTE